MTDKIVLATDLDRTLLPNGLQSADREGMNIFQKILNEHNFYLVYVTGRHLGLVNQARQEYNIPCPDFLISDVGTKIYKKSENELVADKDWTKLVRAETKKWDIDKFTQAISDIEDIKIQEEIKQNEFKLSYYLPNPDMSDKVVGEIEKRILSICSDAVIVYSVDETENMGLIDILPKYATKIAGLEYIREKLNLNKTDLVYCGDSGNDILPLTFGYKAILVKNAITEVKKEVKRILEKKEIDNKLYIAQGTDKLSGYYVSGIIEGLVHFGIIPDLL